MNFDILYRAAFLIPEAEPYGSWVDRAVGNVRKIPNLGTVTLVQNERERDAWSEMDTYVLVFEVVTPDGEKAHFKKLGYEDSYGAERWHGNLIPVKAETKTVVTYVGV